MVTKIQDTMDERRREEHQILPQLHDPEKTHQHNPK
jgi:hypothetical protein